MDGKNLRAKDKQELESKAEMTQPGPVFLPAVDIFESEGSLILVADMPGVNSEGVEIQLEDNELTLRGRVRREAPGLRQIYSEYRLGDYLRKFTLSNVIDQQHIEASMKNGVLKVTLPKAEAAKPRQIVVKAG